ncbi:efflux RND transporter periplasmic adaptor subunit [Vibrio sagamiensis]|uniref:MexH family multidrug efflux RND transporter periplasmic adaptor subunit n=1 Tax=Vibrio sagamiensis NBRC 104589 TaxID=1219064 RepID=A0A511QHJ4_9VIBR|nr:efflux RND transporter periplasmic adaptor subunit [Vibrio sagamiensis]PNQ61717.1 MexH family multidrug efflux RND transporter periplasmic adaptor subunit [Vibrio agarivorans]GEM75922.1 MexH family multidrug efflux RND transporter periplasmic adaptor subunit [Vibrio sagamiensis NBRC 104589]
MKKWTFFMLLIATLLFGSVIGFNIFKKMKTEEFLASRPEPEFPITVTTASSEDWTPFIDVIGFIEPNQGVTLASENSGTITSIQFESGDKVEKDQTLVELDSEVQKANLDSAVAALPASEGKYKRYRGLIKTGAISKEAFDEAQANYLSQKANIESLRAQIELRQIKAPFAGKVGLRNVFLGQFLQSGSSVVRLEDTSIMRFRFTVPQTDLSKLKLGQSLQINVDAYPEVKFDGNITAIEPAVNYQSGLVQVQASIPNSDGRLRSGMFARAKVILPVLKNQIVLPQTAVSYALYGNTVYVVNKDENDDLRVKQVVITTGERTGDKVHVLDGIKDGEKVVTSGQVRLSNDVKVKEVQNDALDTPATTPKL